MLSLSHRILLKEICWFAKCLSSPVVNNSTLVAQHKGWGSSGLGRIDKAKMNVLPPDLAAQSKTDLAVFLESPYHKFCVSSSLTHHSLRIAFSRNGVGVCGCSGPLV